MTSVKLEYVQDHLAELVEKAGMGESFLIERTGKPLVKLSVCEPPAQASVKRTGFMRGQIKVPADFDTMGSEEIAQTFEQGK